jgi:colicin import membrane protein
MPPPTVHGFRPWLGSVVVHVLLIGLLVGFALNWRSDPPEQQLALEGRVVSENELPPALRSTPQRPAPPTSRVEPRPEPVPAPEPQVPPEPDRTDELRRQAEEQARVAAERQRAELERAAQERKTREAAELQRVAAADAERRRLEAEAEQKRKAEQARREQEAQLARQRETEAKAKAAAQAEADRAARQRAEREAELRRELASEEEGEAIQRSGIVDEYRVLLTQTIERNWIRPPSARAGLKCTINVTQASGGTVIDVQFGPCNGDQAVRESVANAVYRSSPLPPPRDPRAFQRQLMIVFSPTE